MNQGPWRPDIVHIDLSQRPVALALVRDYNRLLGDFASLQRQYLGTVHLQDMEQSETNQLIWLRKIYYQSEEVLRKKSYKTIRLFFHLVTRILLPKALVQRWNKHIKPREARAYSYGKTLVMRAINPRPCIQPMPVINHGARGLGAQNNVSQIDIDWDQNVSPICITCHTRVPNVLYMPCKCRSTCGICHAINAPANCDQHFAPIAIQYKIEQYASSPQRQAYGKEQGADAATGEVFQSPQKDYQFQPQLLDTLNFEQTLLDHPILNSIQEQTQSFANPEVVDYESQGYGIQDRDKFPQIMGLKQFCADAASKIKVQHLSILMSRRIISISSMHFPIAFNKFEFGFKISHIFYGYMHQPRLIHLDISSSKQNKLIFIGMVRIKNILNYIRASDHF